MGRLLVLAALALAAVTACSSASEETRAAGSPTPPPQSTPAGIQAVAGFDCAGAIRGSLSADRAFGGLTPTPLTLLWTDETSATEAVEAVSALPDCAHAQVQLRVVRFPLAQLEATRAGVELDPELVIGAVIDEAENLVVVTLSREITDPFGALGLPDDGSVRFEAGIVVRPVGSTDRP